MFARVRGQEATEGFVHRQLVLACGADAESPRFCRHDASFREGAAVTCQNEEARRSLPGNGKVNEPDDSAVTFATHDREFPRSPCRGSQGHDLPRELA